LPGTFVGSHPVGDKVPVQFRAGVAFVSIRDVAPSETVS
jgi:hypothetical protein